MVARVFAAMVLVSIGLVGLSISALAKDNPGQGHHFGPCCNAGHHYGQLKHQPASQPPPTTTTPGGTSAAGGPQTNTRGLGGAQGTSAPESTPIALPAFHLRLPFDTQPAVQRIPAPSGEQWLLWLALLGLIVLWLWAFTRGTLVALRRRRAAATATGASPAA